MMPLDQLPDHIVSLIEPFVEGVNFQDVEVHVGALPAAYTPVAVAAMPMDLIPVATAIGTDIYINPRYADFQTASGLSLLVHESVHVQQYLEDPHFLAHYNEYARVTPQDRPWENPYEWEAYITECEAYDWYLLQGIPAGRWLPLGKTMGFCN